MSKPFAWLKNFALLLALGLASCLSPAHAAFINGQNYVPVADWARANGLKCFWLKRGDEIVAANRATRLVFDKDSRMVEVNGINVALSFPVAVDKGTPLIAQLDLNTTIRPLLSPPKAADAKRITTICLDPGHGGKDTGNHTFWRSEKTYTLALALELRDQLKKVGFNVILTRSKDAYVELPDRPVLANRRGADLFVSLHFNSFAPEQKEAGLETFCLTPAGMPSTLTRDYADYVAQVFPNNAHDVENWAYAVKLHRALLRTNLLADRGVRHARFMGVLRGQNRPALLIEGGYLSNPAEARRIAAPAFRQKLAEAMAAALK